MEMEASQEAVGSAGWRKALGMLILALGLLLPVVGSAQGMMTEATYNRLERAYEAMDEEDYETAREWLNAARDRVSNDHERSVVSQVSGFVYLNVEDYESALEEFKQAIEFGGLPLPRQLTTISNVAQLYTQFEEYENALEYVQRYLDLIEESEERDEAPPRIYLIGAQSHMQLEQYREALPFIRNAIDLAEEPNESHYRVLLAIHFQLDQFEEGVEVLEQMLGYWPNKMTYWFQLFSLNMQLERDQEALNALSLAYRKGLFETESHYKNLARLHMVQEAPFEAGEVLTAGLDAGAVDEDEDNLEMLSRAWIRAKEYGRAIDTLRQIAEIDETGEPYLRIAQLHQERAEWDETYEAAMEAFERGGLDDPGEPLLLAGRAAVRNKDYDRALSVFNRAMEYDDAEEQASQWVRYIEEERSLLEQE